MLAPNAKLRKSVIQSAGPAGATLLLVRIYECLPLLCPRCNRPMRILAFIQDPPVIEKILHHIDEPTQPPKVLPARAGTELPSRLKKREWERRMRVTASADSVREPAGAGHRRWGWVQEGEGGAKRRVGDARDPIRAGTRLPRKGGWIYYPFDTDGEQQQRDADLGQKFDLVGIVDGDAAGVRPQDHPRGDRTQQHGLA